MPWAFAYAPRGPVAAAWTPDAIARLHRRASGSALPAAAGRVSHLRIDPEIELDGPLDADGALRRALRAAGWRPAPPIQPNATRIIDLRADEAALWGDLRKKWRQYVNKARSGGVTVVDGGGDRLAEFYRIYRETADRAGFLIRTEAAYRDVWDAFAPAGRARLLFAQAAGRRAGGDALPGPLRAAGRRAVRRDDRGRRRVAGQLPAQVGGDPLVARGRAPRATTCGASRPAGSPTSRPGSADARSATSAPGTSCSTRSAGASTSWPSAAGSGGRAGGTGSRGGGSAAGATGARRVNVRDATPGRARRLGRAHGRGARRPRLPVAGLGRASRGASAGGRASSSSTTAAGSSR